MPSLPRTTRTWLAASLLPAVFLLASCSTEPTKTGGSTNTTSSGAGGTGGAAGAALFETPRKADGTINIQIVTNGISPFWDPMAAGMKKAAAELGCTAEWSGPEHSLVSEQKQMVENAVSKGADGIAVSAIEGEAAKGFIDPVITDKSIPVITFDSDSTSSKRLAYIGTNNYNAGKVAGEAAIKLLPKGGTFVAFVGNVSAENARDRQRGFEDATKDHNIKIETVLQDDKDPQRARRNVEDSIAKYGDKIQGFLGLYSYNGPAIAQALKNGGQRDKYKIVCFDAEPNTLKELEANNIDATVVQKPYDFGYLSTKLLYLINRKGLSAAKKEMKIPDTGIYDTGVETITPANVKEYRQNLEKLGVKSS